MKHLVVIGSLNMDYVMYVPRVPEAGETLSSSGMALNCGGKGANQAYAAARLGADVSLLGATGADADGDALRASLTGAGVRVDRLLREEKISTGRAFIMVEESGENRIVLAPGANLAVTPAYLDTQRALIAECDAVLLQLEIPLDTVLYAAQMARSLGKKVILDPAPAKTRLPGELLACADLIKPNETELGILLEDADARKNLRDAAGRLRRAGVKNVLISLGERGSYLMDEQGREYRSPALPVHAVDTTAAGDCYIAAVALARAEGRNWPDAMAFAGRAAALAVTRKGAQPSLPSRAEVDAAFRDQIT